MNSFAFVGPTVDYIMSSNLTLLFYDKKWAGEREIVPKNELCAEVSKVDGDHASHLMLVKL